MTDNEEFEEAMGIAEEFDRMTCQEQVRATLIPLTLIANRVKVLEGDE